MYPNRAFEILDPEFVKTNFNLDLNLFYKHSTPSWFLLPDNPIT